MANPYIPVTGIRSDITAVDPDQIKSTLNPVNFTLSTNAGTYSPEQYTTSYIGSIFRAITQLEDSWNGCKQTAMNYINDFEDVPLTEDMTTTAEDIISEDDSIPVDNSNPNVVATGVLGFGVVNTAMLNIRKDSNANSQILGTYKKDDRIEILGYSGNNDNWIEVKLPDGTIGYISKKYVDVSENNQTVQSDRSNTSEQPAEVIETLEEPVVEEPVQEPVEEVGSIQGKVSTHGSNLRIRDKNHNIIGSLSNNSDVKIIGKVETQDGPFYEIDLGNGKVGRVSAQWVKAESNSIPNQTPSPVETPSQEASVPSSSAPMKGTVATSTGSLRVRRGPSLEDEVVGYLPRNGDVDILEYSPDPNEKWAKILYNGEEMYVYKDKVNLR